jgi:hypothetical protein
MEGRMPKKPRKTRPTARAKEAAERRAFWSRIRKRLKRSA